MRVAFVPRSTEIQPIFCRFVGARLIASASTFPPFPVRPLGGPTNMTWACPNSRALRPAGARRASEPFAFRKKLSETREEGRAFGAENRSREGQSVSRVGVQTPQGSRTHSFSLPLSALVAAMKKGTVGGWGPGLGLPTHCKVGLATPKKKGRKP